MLVSTIGIALILFATVGAVRWGRARPVRSSTEELLDARLARGEISADEHRRRRQVLGETAPRQAPAAVWWLVSGVGVLLLVAGPLTAGPGTGTGWWADHHRNMAGHMRWSGTATAPAEPLVSGAPEVVIEAGDMWFDPDRLEIDAGATVNLVLDNTGQAFHDLAIRGLDLHLEAGAGETAKGALHTPEAGRYEFLCTVRGHASAGMRGELVVTTTP